MNQGFEMNAYVPPVHFVEKNPQNLQQYLTSNKRELSCWGLLLTSIGVIYFGFSDGQFSFGYTLSAMIQMFGFMLIALKAVTTRSVNGLSLNTFICYSVSILAKLFSITFYNAYCPSDASGEVIFRASHLFAFVTCLGMVYLITKKFKTTYTAMFDKINCLLLIVPALILACLVHPTLNDKYAGDISWTFSHYLEVVAMLPQLYMLSKKGGEIESFTSHFVASQGFSLCFASVFWFGVYHEINQSVGESWTLFAEHTGSVIMICQVIQILFFSDFLYEYIKSMRRGVPMKMDKTHYL